jgi:Ni,Fe-hydrogenase I small subunit
MSESIKKTLAFAAHSAALHDVDFINFEICPCGQKTTTNQTQLCLELSRQLMEGCQAPIDCIKVGGRWYSRLHPDRCVEELMFGAYAMYEKVGSEGVHRGVCSQLGAYQWLNGEDIESIDGRLSVDGVTID